MLLCNLALGSQATSAAGGGGGPETDPIYGAAPASGITAGQITNWDTAFGWGNHAGAGYFDLGAATNTLNNAADQTIKKANTVSGAGVDVIFEGSNAGGGPSADGGNFKFRMGLGIAGGNAGNFYNDAAFTYLDSSSTQFIKKLDVNTVGQAPSLHIQGSNNAHPSGGGGDIILETLKPGGSGGRGEIITIGQIRADNAFKGVFTISGYRDIELNATTSELRMGNITNGKGRIEIGNQSAGTSNITGEGADLAGDIAINARSGNVYFISFDDETNDQYILLDRATGGQAFGRFGWNGTDELYEISQVPDGAPTTYYPFRIINANGQFDLLVNGTMSLGDGTNNGVTVDASQNTTLGKGALGSTATDGYAYMPNCDGLDTEGSPPTPSAKSGWTPFCYDNTAAKMCVYTSSAWSCTAL